MNLFSTKDERVWSWRRNNSFKAIETKASSAKDGTRLKLKANMFGARDELTRLAIERNTLAPEANVFHSKLRTHFYSLA